MIRQCLSVLICFAIAGCATEATPINQATPVPTARQWAPPPPKSVNPAQVVFIRDTGSSAQDAQVHLFIDGRKVATLLPGEIASFAVEPGDRQISADHSWNLFGQMKPLNLDGRAEPGQRLLYRVGFDNIAGTVKLVMYRDVLTP